MKLRLIAGTINRWSSNEEWANYHLDIAPRGIWDRELQMAVLPDFIADIAELTVFRDETFDEIRLNHVLEHLPPARATLALEELNRVLKPGGVLDIEVPDVGRVCKAFTYDELDLAGVSQWLLGEQLSNHEPSDSHRSAWTEGSLRAGLEEAGFEVGEREDSGLALRFVAVKP